MSAHIKTDMSNDTVSTYCLECFGGVPEGIIHVWPLCKAGVESAEHMRDAHNDAKHPVFKPAILTVPESTHREEWDFIPEGEHIPMNTPDEIAAAHDRIRRLQIEALKRDIAALQADLQERNIIIGELGETINELMETPDPMPLCKNLEGHNYIALDHMFVFCNRCGHSIHYKTR